MFQLFGMREAMGEAGKEYGGKELVCSEGGFSFFSMMEAVRGMGKGLVQDVGEMFVIRGKLNPASAQSPFRSSPNLS